MAYLKYRGTKPTSVWTVDSENQTTGLTNLDIDTNFYTLDQSKLEKSGGTISGDLTVNGNLTVGGSTTVINSTVISVQDVNIELGKVATPTDITANGGGITLKGTTDKTIIWDNTNSNWTSSENWNLLTGKTYKINNVQVLSSTALGSTVTGSSLTKLGLTSAGFVKSDASGNLSVDSTSYLSGTVGTTSGGTGLTTYAAGDILYASAVNTLSKLSKGTDGQVLKLSGGVPTWAADNDTTYAKANTTTLGLVKLVDSTVQTVSPNAATAASSRSYSIQLNGSDQMVVNVPWTDTTYSKATSTTLGLVKLGDSAVQLTAANAVSATASRSYAVQMNSSDQLVVNVPWTDTTYSKADSGTFGLVKLVDTTVQTATTNALTNTASRSYAVQMNASDQLVVNVPWTDTNTTYSIATTSTPGLVKLADSAVQSVVANAITTTASRSYAVQLNPSDQMVVNVPWTDTTYSKATPSNFGLVKLVDATVQTINANSVTATASRSYAVQMNSSDQLVVNVPWTDSDTTYSKATSTTLGLVKLVDPTVQTVTASALTTAANRSYAVQMNSSDQLVVNVPWTDNDTTYSKANTTTLGLVKLADATVQTVSANAVSSTTSRSYAVQLNNLDQMVVNVPWTDTVTTYSKADTATLGLVKLADATVQTTAANVVSSTASRSYAVQLNSSDQMVVNVPWTDTVTTYSKANTTTLGLVKLADATVQTVSANAVSATASRSYAVQLNSSDQMVVNVPWSDTNTTYTAGTGLTLTSTSFSVNFGTTSTTACVGNDSRLSDARTPLAHVHAASDITSGILDPARLGSGTASSATFLRGDQTWATVTGGASLADDTSTNANTFYPTLSYNTTTGAPATLYVSSTKFYFNPSTGTVNATAFNAISDRRFKKDLEQITSALDKVCQLTGYTFTMIDSEQRSTGLIAQDVEKVLPEAVGGTEEMKNVNYGAIMGLIVESLKELNNKVDMLQNQLLNK